MSGPWLGALSNNRWWGYYCLGDELKRKCRAGLCHLELICWFITWFTSSITAEYHVNQRSHRRYYNLKIMGNMQDGYGDRGRKEYRYIDHRHNQVSKFETLGSRYRALRMNSPVEGCGGGACGLVMTWVTQGHAIRRRDRNEYDLTKQAGQLGADDEAFFFSLTDVRANQLPYSTIYNWYIWCVASSISQLVPEEVA